MQLLPIATDPLDLTSAAAPIATMLELFAARTEDGPITTEFVTVAPATPPSMASTVLQLFPKWLLYPMFTH